MIAADVTEAGDFESWRDRARQLVAGGTPPQKIIWREEGRTLDLFAPTVPPVSVPGAMRKKVRASRAFLDLAPHAFLHRDPARLDLLYRVLWRLQSKPHLLADETDADVLALRRLARQVRRDIHKMRAFLRFRALPSGDHGDPGQHDLQKEEHFVAWFEPEHRIEAYNARFFVERFANQRWSILTPRLSLHWDGKGPRGTLTRGPAASRADAPAHDATEELWLAYYRSIFNPARLKVGAMLKEMPRKYWKNLPEAREIRPLIAGARARETAMIETGQSLFAEASPEGLEVIAAGIDQCRRCAIGCTATRAVMGEGPRQATLMIVGEQPGDMEDTQRRPFAGPAGRLLDEYLGRAGIVRKDAYVTNAVKHFKFVPRGKRRLHQTPSAREIDICRWWLDAERALVKPRFVLALGASAGRALLGRTPAIARERASALPATDGATVWLTSHPSYLLRLDGDARRREEMRFQKDLADLYGLIEASGKAA